MPVGTLKEAKDFAQKWMIDMGYFGREVDPCPDGFHFMLEGTEPNQIPFLIIQSKESEGFFIVLATVRVTDSSFNSLNALSKEDRDEFLWNLQKDLLSLPPTLSFDPTFNETGVPKGVQFSQEIYFEDLTRGMLSESVKNTTKCALWTVLSFRRRFGDNQEAEHAE